MTSEFSYRPSLKQRLMLEGRLPEYLAKKEARLAKISHLATGSQQILDFDDMAYYSMSRETENRIFKKNLKHHDQ